MSETRIRLSEGAAMLEFLERGAAGHGDEARAVEREIIDRELIELEQDVLNDPGALERLLVPVRLRWRRREG